MQYACMNIHSHPQLSQPVGHVVEGERPVCVFRESGVLDKAMHEHTVHTMHKCTRYTQTHVHFSLVPGLSSDYGT